MHVPPPVPCTALRGRRAAAVLLCALTLVGPAVPAAAAGPAAAPPDGVQAAPGWRVTPTTGRALLRAGDAQRDSAVRSVRRSALRTRAAVGGGAVFRVRYSGFTARQRDAFQLAVDTWARLVTSPVPIVIDARAAALPPGVLGAAAASAEAVPHDDGRYRPTDTEVPIALANALEGRDLAPGAPDIEALVASDTSQFSFGAEPELGRYDFTTVVLHEIGHGLGFGGSMEVLRDSRGIARGYWDAGTSEPSPQAYDRRAVAVRADGRRVPLLSLPRGSAALAQALTAGRVLWGGPAGTAANGGTRPELYTPRQWQEGSSYVHLDERGFPSGDADSLMTPVLDRGEVIRDPGGIALGMLADIGWGAESRDLRLTGPTSVPAGSRVTVTGTAPPGALVRVWFRRRGSTARGPAGAPGFVLGRVLRVGASGTFATGYAATDDHRYYAQTGRGTTPPVLTQVRPTLSASGAGARVTLRGRGLPGTALRLQFTSARAGVVVRRVRVGRDGRWSRPTVVGGTVRVVAVGANGRASDPVLLRAR